MSYTKCVAPLRDQPAGGGSKCHLVAAATGLKSLEKYQAPYGWIWRMA